MKVLVSDSLAEEGVRRLESGADVDVITNLSPEELIEKIKDYDALVIRSGTKVTADVIKAADRLKVIGRAGVGIDNVDVEAATKKGIIVLNTPGGNTISAAEHTIAMMLALARNIPQANAALHKGEWNRKKYTGVEFFNKTLGIVGLGRVGAEVATRMKSFGMQILAFDPFVTEERAKQMGLTLAPLETVLREGDFITVHTPLTNETRNLIDEDEFKIMKPGVRIVNCARGGIINEAALAKAVAEGKVAGAAVDVFTKEPPTGNPLLEQEKIITTPHLGASTAEAQVNVALAVADQILTIARGGLPTNAINMPAISPETLAVMEPFMKLAEKMGSLAGQLVGRGFESTGAHLRRNGGREGYPARYHICHQGPAGKPDGSRQRELRQRPEDAERDGSQAPGEQDGVRQWIQQCHDPQADQERRGDVQFRVRSPETRRSASSS